MRWGVALERCRNINQEILMKKILIAAVSLSFLASGALAQVSDSNNSNGYGNTNPQGASGASNNANGYGNTNPSATSASSNNSNGYGNTNPSNTPASSNNSNGYGNTNPATTSR